MVLIIIIIFFNRLKFVKIFRTRNNTYILCGICLSTTHFVKVLRACVAEFSALLFYYLHQITENLIKGKLDTKLNIGISFAIKNLIAKS